MLPASWISGIEPYESAYILEKFESISMSVDWKQTFQLISRPWESVKLSDLSNEWMIGCVLGMWGIVQTAGAQAILYTKNYESYCCES